MTLSETLEPVRPLSSWFATPPSRRARREPIENMALGGAPPMRAATARRVTTTLSRPSSRWAKNSGAGLIASTRAAFAAPPG